MKNGQTFSAVIFDLDGVLTDTAHYHYLAWKRMAEKLGVPFDEAFNEQLKGVDRMGSLALILARGGVALPDTEQQKLAEEKNADYLKLISSMSPADLLPGALQVLRQIRQQGIKTGLASASKNAQLVLDKLGISDCFDTVVDANHVINGKPDPEIFLKAAAQLGVEAHRCLGVEDSLAGIRSIKSAGMTALGIGDPQTLTQADMVIAGLHQFDLSGLLAM